MTHAEDVGMRGAPGANRVVAVVATKPFVAASDAYTIHVSDKRIAEICGEPIVYRVKDGSLIAECAGYAALKDLHEGRYAFVADFHHLAGMLQTMMQDPKP